MNLDPELLARLQFAFTIMFHYIFPPFSIGLGLLIVIYESLYVFKKKAIYEKIARFWVKIFAANFAVGVATGIVMEFEFGTNWSTYSRYVGDVFGSPLAAEGIFAFFLESGFLSILLFGWHRVSKGMHLFSTFMVFIGSTMSAFWIVVANSWQQTPAAFEIVTNNGASRAVITDFWGMVFNPSALVRFEHVVVGAFIQGAFLVLSISAYYILKNKYEDFAKSSFRIALIVMTLASFLQLFLGDLSAKIVAEHQPAKFAALEGLYETRSNAPLYAFGWVDEKNEKTTGLAIPGMLSFLTHGDFNATVNGLDKIPVDERPPVNRTFQVYHIMITLGFFFIGLSVFSLIMLGMKKLYTTKWLMKVYVGAVILPVIANQCGWMTAEFGRQPWVVWGLLKTSDGISKTVTAPEILTSLILFFIVYVLLFFVWIYVLDKEIKHGPEHFEDLPYAGYARRGDRADTIEGNV
ncbi:cytochrome ubiquinol oxidase subunit I [Aureibacter tunicatorum]|uniref:Cytochrome d ubiquinol oxidase subunit I n=1 Tax=Aureibacter tunicatorum TaxID=866807 RepID=A0AAE3XKA3_9BACT|nr:cytochrome ubiquinol oxidase subunit I [Aureibacter tunicatorum]MDR6238188.1 cytochrome d ubiquinol oxidase subunit I [Aureibacter tunicatorum]BDD03221.1 cytochrome ubiquinol oxidase subunit I [Aureibacter tunicatorum]